MRSSRQIDTLTEIRCALFCPILYIILCVVLCLITWSLHPYSTSADDTSYRIRIPMGRTRTVPVELTQTVVVGDATIAGARLLPGGKELLLTARSPGLTNLEIVSTKGEHRSFLLRILRQDPSLVISDLQELFRTMPEIEIRAIGEKVLVEGTAAGSDGYAMVQKILAGYPEVLNLVAEPPVALGRMVAVQLLLVEVSDSRTVSIGLGWPDGIAVDVSLSGTLSPGSGPLQGIVGAASSLRQTLAMMSQNGTARILARPVLVARDGTESRFSAGGQIPVPQVNGLGQNSVEWKNYGLEFVFTPRIDAYGNIDLTLRAESSQLDYGNAIQSTAGTLPALRMRHTSGRVNLARGEALLLAELFSTEDGKSNSQTPVLGSIPIVGEFFRMRSVRHEERRSMLVVIPEPVLPGSLGNSAQTAATNLYSNAASGTAPKWVESFP